MKYYSASTLALNQCSPPPPPPPPNSPLNCGSSSSGSGTSKSIPITTKPPLVTMTTCYNPIVKYMITGEGDLCSSPTTAALMCGSNNYFYMIDSTTTTTDFYHANNNYATGAISNQSSVTPPLLQKQKTDSKRSSSLKSLSKNEESSSSSSKKIVRFADSLGLDLADVKLFLDEIPNVPRSAFRDLQDAIDVRKSSSTELLKKPIIIERSLLPSFHPPGDLPDFLERIDKQKVLLESCHLLEKNKIKGTVRVRNVGFSKGVTVRYTSNEWVDVQEVEATYVDNSCDGFSDKFTFQLDVGNRKDLQTIGAKLSFCLRYSCEGSEYWDSNLGRNYVFHCV